MWAEPVNVIEKCGMFLIWLLVCFYSFASAAALAVARRAINRLTPRPTNIAVAVERHMSAIMYGSAVPTTDTSRIAVKGAFSKSATAADSMHSTRMDTGMAGKIRLRAIAIIVQENKVGNVGP